MQVKGVCYDKKITGRVHSVTCLLSHKHGGLKKKLQVKCNIDVTFLMCLTKHSYGHHVLWLR
jgi:hypothetical protein